MSFILALAAVILFGSGEIHHAAAQTVTVQGIISDASNGEILEGANVALQDLETDQLRGMATDWNGYYQVSGIPAGRHLLRISFIGYVTYEDTLELGEQSIVNVSLALEVDEALLGEIVVGGGSGIVRRELGRQRITSVDMARIPTPAAGGDLASYIQAIPGVVATGDRGGQLYIRGGTPSQNMVLIDGMMIYQPFHIVGFFSAFPEELVSNANFYTGGFGSRYTGRIASVLDVQMRDGNMERLRGSASVSPFVADVLFEGPIKPGRSSWIASARRSLIEETSPHFLSEQQPLRFESLFFRASHVENELRCSTTGIRTYDRGRLDFEGDDVFKWSNFVLGGRCVTLPDQANYILDVSAAVSHISNATEGSVVSDLSSQVTRAHTELNLTQFAGRLRFDYGFNVHLKVMNYNMDELFHDSQQGSTTMIGTGGYVEAGIPIGENLTVQPGVAFTFYPDFYPLALEPRLRASWQPFGSDSEEVHGTLGLYNQALTGITDMRDASSVFVAWMPSPDGRRMSSIHGVLGWQQSLGGGLSWSIEGYYKWLRNQPVTVWNTIASFTTDLALADGEVRGGDIRVEYNRGPFYGFVGYGYSWTMYEAAQESFGTWFGEPVQRYHPPHDRRHQINAMTSWTFGEYTAGVRWQFGTGLVYTRPMGFDELHRFDQGLPDVRRSFGTPRVILERPYDGRLPTFHRLDVSLARTIEFPNVSLALQAGAINSYDHRNIFYYDVYTHRRIDQMPLLPYVSLKLEVN